MPQTSAAPSSCNSLLGKHIQGLPWTAKIVIIHKYMSPYVVSFSTLLVFETLVGTNRCLLARDGLVEQKKSWLVDGWSVSIGTASVSPSYVGTFGKVRRVVMVTSGDTM